MSPSDDSNTIELGSEGLDWVRDSLSAGLSLSESFLRLRGVESGKAKSFVPAGVDAHKAINALEHGGLMTTSMSHEELSRHLDPGGNVWWLVVENDVGRVGDPYLASAADVFFFGDEVYHFRKCPQEPEPLGRFLMGSSSGYPLNGFVVTSGVPRLNAELDEEGLERLVISTVRVIVTAYDGEGYLIWAE